MARLAAKEKVLFYPTPLEIVECIVSNVAAGGPGSICDPCCGTGEPLASLGQRLGLTTYGNELHPERFVQAQPRLDHCLNGAREFLQVDGLFNVTFNNPPYDQALSGQRMEVEHLSLDLHLLLPDGLGIWVIPETIIDDQLCLLLAGHLHQVNIRRFPQPEYDRFKQVVIFGLKRAETNPHTYVLAMELAALVRKEPPVLQTGEFQYSYPRDQDTIRGFALCFPATNTILEELDTVGIQTGEIWQTLFGHRGAGFAHFQPLLALMSGHTAMAIAAGIVNGTEAEIDGETHLIKGSTSKRIVVSQETEHTDDGVQQIVREREQLVQTITALNLMNGTLVGYNSLDDQQGFADFLLAHQQVLVQTIEQHFPPLFEPDQDMAAWLPTLNRVRAPGKLSGRLVAEGLLPAQQVRAAALATRLKTAHSGILVGEPGVGKTATAQALAALIGQGHWKLVVVCPAQVTDKWKREAELVLRDFGVKVHLIGRRRRQADGQGQWRKIAKPVLDVMRAMAEPHPSVLVMSYETAKNGPRWEHAPMQVRKPIRYHIEVEETETLPDYPFQRTTSVEKVVCQVEQVLCCPDCGEVLMTEFGPVTSMEDQMGNRKHWCRHCRAALWQQVPFQYGGRVAIADFLNRRYSGRYNLILDEAHHVRGADTDAGYASADLVAGARKVIAMTGTIYNGKASGIFHLLYRLLPSFRQLYGYNEVQRFIEHHGLQETITRTKAGDRYHSAYGYSRENVRVRELPGVSPGMVTLLLPNTAFLKLADVGFALPPYTEERLPIPLDARLGDGLHDIAHIYNDAAKLAREGQPGLLSAWLYASLA